jgi:hypothetical protein
MQWAVVQQASRNTAHVSVASCLEEEEEGIGGWALPIQEEWAVASNRGGGQRSVAFHDSP